MLQDSVLDDVKTVSAGNQVGRQRHRVNPVVSDRLVLGNAAPGAQDAEASDPTSCWLGDVQLHVEPWWGTGNQSESSSTSKTSNTKGQQLGDVQLVMGEPVVTSLQEEPEFLALEPLRSS